MCQIIGFGLMIAYAGALLVGDSAGMLQLDDGRSGSSDESKSARSRSSLAFDRARSFMDDQPELQVAVAIVMVSSILATGGWAFLKMMNWIFMEEDSGGSKAGEHDDAGSDESLDSDLGDSAAWARDVAPTAKAVPIGVGRAEVARAARKQYTAVD